MLKEERQDFILKRAGIDNKVRASDLSVLLNVSVDTVRRDIQELVERGRITKIFGGAQAKTFNYPFQQTVVYACEKKQVVARKALSLLKDDMVLLVGGGTIMIEFSKMIPPDFKGTFFTISPLVALELAERSSVDVILLAGRLAPHSYTCIGASVISQFAGINADLCLMGSYGVSLKDGATDDDWEVVQVKKAMTRTSCKTAVLTLSENLEVTRKIQICGLNSIDYLITELDPAEKQLDRYSKRVTAM